MSKRERPILFSAPMVRAILAGTKTQTRRIVKQEHLPWLENSVANFLDGKWNQRPLPYGQPGDRLWVRETHAPQSDCWGAWHNWMKRDPFSPKPIIHYAADGGDPFVDRWRPSIHMPRWASRITLEVTGVRVERLQDISEADCCAEGTPGGHGSIPGYNYNATPREQYRALWESINGTGSWDANPWVWVLEFRSVIAVAKEKSK